ncbi:MAG TPA: hypothetical protein VMA98_09535 [Candidatus Acidoferrales bacterium]|nr:hypothetical protein [Candidatus Acidoferrales bacterium]
MNSLSLLVRNPVIVLPGIIVGAAAAAAEFALVALALPDWMLTGALFLVALVLALAQMAYVTGMAGAAWRHGRTGLRDGWDALTHRGFAAAGAGALLVLIGFCAAVLTPATLGITLLAYAVFFIYTMAAVVIGERAPIAGIVESASTALANIMPTIGIVALIAVIAALGGWLGSLAGRLSEVGGALVAGLLQQVIVAYASLVVAGEYLKLTKRLDVS